LRALQNLHDQGQVGNPLVGALLNRLQPRDLSLGHLQPDLFRGLFARQRENHRFQRINVVRQVAKGQIHAGE
jgi:hypothetical protein